MICLEMLDVNGVKFIFGIVMYIYIIPKAYSYRLAKIDLAKRKENLE